MLTSEPTTEQRALHARAVEAQSASYSPHSHFRVGAAVEVEDGRIFTGCNLDNASFPVSVCAEQSAVAAAVSAGARRIRAVAVAGDAESVSPCGKCRQLLIEFADTETAVVYRWEGRLVVVAISDLLPHSFELND